MLISILVGGSVRARSGEARDHAGAASTRRIARPRLMQCSILVSLNAAAQKVKCVRGPRIFAAFVAGLELCAAWRGARDRTSGVAGCSIACCGYGWMEY
ncbi:hypothetical protein [Vineibacter terrae]|uniref:hypothetical protein n=1 Tax=Vineibacter terrae TaxID=2586908 RepID=UPI002E37F002|nr:hypothetical protein [Vineibacter terrae]HEX2889483.1 hypothetical protein [Vineibacter terrae]